MESEGKGVKVSDEEGEKGRRDDAKVEVKSGVRRQRGEGVWREKESSWVWAVQMDSL